MARGEGLHRPLLLARRLRRLGVRAREDPGDQGPSAVERPRGVCVFLAYAGGRLAAGGWIVVPGVAEGPAAIAGGAACAVGLRRGGAGAGVGVSCCCSCGQVLAARSGAGP